MSSLNSYYRNPAAQDPQVQRKNSLRISSATTQGWRMRNVKNLYKTTTSIKHEQLLHLKKSNPEAFAKALKDLQKATSQV